MYRNTGIRELYSYRTGNVPLRYFSGAIPEDLLEDFIDSIPNIERLHLSPDSHADSDEADRLARYSTAVKKLKNLTHLFGMMWTSSPMPLLETVIIDLVKSTKLTYIQLVNDGGRARVATLIRDNTDRYQGYHFDDEETVLRPWEWGEIFRGIMRSDIGHVY
ncbi:hypothetical protein M422DRAFT_274757 [Sphaerobolus stellatus SS14]|uniref:Uncharacterized protein n=1 Tax=Sphaerobolus stellatus (strain SS14) TaxID=990650 RepID=A0A0C9TRF4_SPHS4|nr:hypothetical protein M422DRAFT_274757 [Sphaerobolus stellatus SS14]